MTNLTLSNTDKLSMLSNLSTLLGSGIPIVESVESLLEDTKGNQRKILESLRADLMQGKQMSDSLSSFPRVFDKVAINLINAAEKAGTLETTLHDIQKHIQEEIEFADKIKFAMIYPLLIMVVFAGVFVMILTVVIPKISVVFSRLKVDLPLPTRILIGMSNLLIHQTVWLALGVVVVVGGLILLYRSNKQLLLNILFRAPIISDLVQKIDYARFSRSVHLLLSSGLPITTALDLAADVVMDSRTSKLIDKSREMVIGGKRLSDGFKQHKKQVPALLIKMMEAGERTGTLDKAMQEISQHLNYEVENSLKAATALLEPILLVVVGVSVGGMMLAIIAPIYGLIGQGGGGWWAAD